MSIKSFNVKAGLSVGPTLLSVIDTNGNATFNSFTANSVDITGNITTTGNVTATSYFGDGSNLTGIAPTVQVYEYANVASDVGTYLSTQWLSDYTAGPVANVTVTVSTTPTLLESFITDPGFPGLSVLPLGVVSTTIRTTKASGTRQYSSFARIYKRSTGGTETLLLTTESTPVSNSNLTIETTLIAVITSSIALDITDRIVTKIYAQTVTGTASITLSFDDNTSCGLQLPALPPTINQVVPYTGATDNVNLGVHSITANTFSGNGSGLTNVTATTANTVTTNAQPNITSLGTLTSLTSNGNVQFTGANVSLGNVANLKVTGGSNFQFLQTNGSGNLVWAEAAHKYSKEWNVDPQDGDDTLGTGSSDSPYKTISKALSMIDNNFNVLYLHQGVYSETVSVTKLNFDIIGPGRGGAYQNGAWSFDSNGASSVRVSGLNFANGISHTGNAPLFLDSVTLVSNLSKTGTGYFQASSSELGGGNITITGNSLVNFYDSIMKNLVVDNSGASVSVLGSPALTTANANAGTLLIKDSIVFSSGNTNYAVVSSASAVVLLEESGVATANGLAGRVNLPGLYTTIDTTYDFANSILGTPIGYTTSFDILRAVGNIQGKNLVTTGVVTTPQINNGGTSNIRITASGNITTSVGGTSNVFTVTSTGANITGTMNATGTITGGNISTGGSLSTGGAILGSANITGANISTAGLVTASRLISNVATGTAPLTVTSTTQVANLNVATAGSATTAGTVTTNAQPNITSTGTLTGLTVSGTSNLGPVGNVTITGGTNGQVLTTNGSNVLSWTTVSGGGGGGANIANGTSNVNIPVSDGNVNTSVAGNANILVITGTGANITGTANITGNANVGNIGGNNAVFTTVAGTLSTAAQPNITSVGNLANLTVSGNIFSPAIVQNASSYDTRIELGSASGIIAVTTNGNSTQFLPGGQINLGGASKIAGGTFGGSELELATSQTNLKQLRDGNVTVQVGTAGSPTSTWTFANTGNLTLPSNTAAINYANGTSITAAVSTAATVTTNAQPNITSTGTLTSLAVTGTTDLGAVGNVTITGGTTGQVLATDGSGNLEFISVATTSITNGNSNVIVTANGNVTTSVAGNANILTVTGTGANINGYLGVTGTVTANTLQLANAITPITAVTGQMFWDTTEHTMTLGMDNGVQQQVGLEQYVKVRASATISDGQAVMFTGANGNNVRAAPADTTSLGFKPEYIIGIATQDIANNGLGYVTVFGIVHGLNTNAWTVGDILWVDNTTPGALTNVQPSDPNFQIQVAAVTKKGAVDGHIQVRLTPFYDLDRLTNVNINTPLNGQGLIYDSANFLWINSNVVAVTAGTVTTNAQPNITSTGTLTSLTVSGTSNLGAVGNVTITGGTSGQVLTTNGSNVLSWTTVGAGSLANGTSSVTIPAINGNVNITVGGTDRIIVTAAGANLTGNLTLTGNVSASRFTSNIANGTAPFTVTSVTRVANLNVANANVADYVQTGTVLGGNYQIAVLQSGGYSPMYGNTAFIANANTGTMFANNFTSAANITVGSAMNVKGFVETVTASANTGTSIAPNALTGTIYNFTANSNFSFDGFTSPIAGQSMTVIITQDGTGSRIMSSTMKFAGGSKTLSTAAGAIDMICVMYDGTKYMASLAKGYA